MTTIGELHLASAIGPATREQLRQWADEHDRMWDRKNRVRRIRFGVLLFAIAALVGAACMSRLHISRIGTWYGSHVDFGTLVIEGMAIGVFTTTVVDRLVLSRSSPVNPWRPIDLTPADLEEQNTDFPGALAYLDAIHHQHRPIVPHDLDVLAMVRQQQQSSKGA
ncbi:hypothetical protein [Paraburkholderia pallida]|uniref:DUF4231 domain-containing protein n=1 Tax=Paraburkholderia pallida TaxID=2547399 RepID=A0A4P7D7U2_9BURK|nr:hypothetical protein [Paraburkholderia pallida]QBR04258.1 hypothetical protein E1956_44870 [Paraburkholderia pallida]